MKKDLLTNYPAKFLFSLFLIIATLIYSPLLQAQGTQPDNSDVKTNPKTGNMYVTATVKQNTPPTTPVLISPANNS